MSSLGERMDLGIWAFAFLGPRMGLMHSDALQCFLANHVKQGRLLQPRAFGVGGGGACCCDCWWQSQEEEDEDMASHQWVLRCQWSELKLCCLGPLFY